MTDLTDTTSIKSNCNKGRGKSSTRPQIATIKKTVNRYSDPEVIDSIGETESKLKQKLTILRRFR
jgi:hypothetical protein